MYVSSHGCSLSHRRLELFLKKNIFFWQKSFQLFKQEMIRVSRVNLKKCLPKIFLEFNLWIDTWTQSCKTFYGCNLLSNVKLGWKGLQWTHTSLFTVLTEKSFQTLTPRPNPIKLYNGRNLQMFMTHLSVCPCQVFPANSNVCKYARSVP